MKKMNEEEMEIARGVTPTKNICSMQSFLILNQLRQTRQLTDAVIKVDNQTFHIHRAIMSACSPYFRALFTNENFNNTNRKNVVIPGVTADIMQMLIDFAYTRQVKVTEENVEQLLPAADQFLVNGVVKACSEFLTKQLEPENCIGIYKFAKTFFCTSLESNSFLFLMQHFTDVFVRSEEFLQLNVDELYTILSYDELNVKNEEPVFDAILTWIDYDSKRRKNFMPYLLKAIRLGLLNTQYFVEKVKPHPYVRDSKECKPIVIETLKFLYDLDINDDKELDFTNPLARPRVPHEILIVVGGWTGGSGSDIVEAYDSRADRWVVCNSIDSGPRAYHGIAAIGHIIYVIGGFDGRENFNCVRTFNPVTKEWAEVAPMNAVRNYVSVAVLDKRIYAMGGYDGHNRQNTAERYYPKKNQWSLIQPMHHQRSDASATACNGKIYICGGFNGQDCLNNAEYFDPTTNQWTMMAAMRNRRSGLGVIQYRGNIFAIGGFNGITRMNTGERYNPETNTWQPLPEMYNPRSNFGIEVVDDMIFACGGFNGVTTISNVECYDGTTDEWYDATDMNVYRSGLSACVVTSLPNVHDYIHKDREKEGSEVKKRTVPSNSDS